MGSCVSVIGISLLNTRGHRILEKRLDGYIDYSNCYRVKFWGGKLPRFSQRL